MSEDHSRGRRRPSREQLTSEQRAYLEGYESSSRYRERDVSKVEEEPRSKMYKKESGSPEDRHYSSGSSSRDSNTHTSRESSHHRIKEEPGAPSSSGGPSTSGGRGGRGDQKDGNRNFRQRYELVHTRPADIQSKIGSQGQTVSLQANYFRILTTPSWRIHQYHVEFSPPVELKRVRGGILSENRAMLGGYLYDGSKIFSCTKLREEKTVLKTKAKNGDEYIITITYVGIISMTEWQSLQVLNLILRRAVGCLKLQMVGRNFFDAVAKIELREYGLQLWPGYQTSIRQHEKDILVCAEIAHKVMRMETLYDILTKCTQTCPDYQEEFRRQILGATVLTDYNNKTYRINDVDFTKDPTTKFLYKEKQVSFVEYYQMKYHIRIRDQHQPLLISIAKERELRTASNDMIILIPELCRSTGLTDNLRNNFQLMRAMSDHTRLNPDRRIDRLRVFNQRLQTTEGSIDILNDWSMKLDRNLVEVRGRILDPQKIVFADHKKVSAGDQADWMRSLRDNNMFSTPSRGLDRWAAIATNRSCRDLRNFVESLMRAAGGMQLRINRPREVIIHDDRNHSFVKALDDCCSQDPQLILVLVPNNNAERYNSIKKVGCLERGVPTQVITQKTAGNPRGLMSIATKVAIQINCKLGYTPWMIDLPLSGLMTIGYDVAKSTRDRSRAFGALVASMDMKTNATFYSTVSEGSSNDVLANSLWLMMTKALRQYRKEHEGKLPTRILFYRDGVSDGSLKQLYDYEVKDVVEKLEQEYKRSQSEKPPMFAYVVVSKQINTRFFARGRNPVPGTVVDDVVTLPERYDFYLVSQSVRQGTVSPTSYNIVYSNIRLTPDQMQLLTYKMTHLYYNWSGTTRVPAVCQYAKKLATLVATNLFQPPQNLLEKKLYYL